MANVKRFHHHHKKAAAAVKQGNIQQARAHVGHMLQALRDNAPAGMPVEPDADQQGGPSDMDPDNASGPQAPMPPQGNPMAALRARLGSMGPQGLRGA